MVRKGFLMVELLIVVVIIGVLASIAIPRFKDSKRLAYLASMKSDLRRDGVRTGVRINTPLARCKSPCEMRDAATRHGQGQNDASD